MLLAIETSSRRASVALGPLGGPYHYQPLEAGRSEALAGAVACLLPDSGFELAGFALGVGPGSFTGLRVGLCFVKGFAIAHPRPLVAVSSFRVVAEQVLRADPAARSVLVALDARNGELLAGLYQRGADGGAAPDLALPDGLYPQLELEARAELWTRPELRLAGEGAALLSTSRPRAEAELWIPRADTLAELAAPELAAGAGQDPLAVEPAYLQKPTAERRREAAAGSGLTPAPPGS